MMFIQEEASEHIEEDLQVVQAMSNSMSTYLDSTAVYYPMATPTYPKLTLGGYLMRQQRLVALSAELSKVNKGWLDTAVFQFQQAINSRITKVEQKGEEEAGIRLRQWQQAVSELWDAPEEAIPYYTTAVENRVMLAALLHHLQQEPYRFNENLAEETAVVDQKLRARWQSGEFIWPQVWQSAYPQDAYWWLYGRPLPPLNK